MNTINIKALSEQVAKLSASGGGSDLPGVTAADNGKVLGVVEGSWNKMNAPTGIVDYSTTEQNTGRKWVDGSPIYSKTYTGLSISVPTAEVWVNTDIAISGLNRLIDCRIWQSNEKAINSPTVAFFDETIENKFRFKIKDNGTVTGIYFEYTKTTTETKVSKKKTTK